MNSIQELRERCDQLHIQREEALKAVLVDYFESSFIEGHSPWKAIIGNKNCKPIPIHRAFRTFGANSSYCRPFEWPNLSEELIRKHLKSLGFAVTEDKIRLSVPACEKGKKLTFAQEWVKKINHSYSQYCAKEKRLAKEVYSALISQLDSTPDKDVKTFEGYTLFYGVKSENPISAKCAAYTRSLMARDMIEEYYDESNNYVGIKVYHPQPQAEAEAEPQS